MARISTIGLLRSLGLVLLSVLMGLVVLINLTPFLDSKDALLDFGSFYASGVKLANGENPYDPNSEFIFDIVFPGVGAGGRMVNLNPPVSLLFFRPLAQFDPQQSFRLWQVVSAGLYATSLILLTYTYLEKMTPLKFLWAFMLAGFWHTIVLGQIYTVMLLLVVLGWVWLRAGRHIPAGIAIGMLVAIKPNFAIWILFLLVSGCLAASTVSILTSLAASAVPLAIYGPRIYSQWLEASALQRETLIMPGNNSLPGLVARFDGIPAGLALSLVFLIVLLVLVRVRIKQGERSLEFISALGILASLLVSPIAWTGYTILLMPIFFSVRTWTTPLLLSAAVLAIPFQIVLLFFQTSFAAFVLFGWLYGWALLLLLGSVVKKTMMTSSIQTN